VVVPKWKDLDCVRHVQRSASTCTKALAWCFNEGHGICDASFVFGGQPFLAQWPCGGGTRDGLHFARHAIG
jgi:hypothetical protein